jgi:hypothetical protein
MIEQHLVLESLKGRLPEDVVATLRSDIAKTRNLSAGY